MALINLCIRTPKGLISTGISLINTIDLIKKYNLEQPIHKLFYGVKIQKINICENLYLETDLEGKKRILNYFVVL